MRVTPHDLIFWAESEDALRVIVRISIPCFERWLARAPPCRPVAPQTKTIGVDMALGESKYYLWSEESLFVLKEIVVKKFNSIYGCGSARVSIVRLLGFHDTTAVSRLIGWCQSRRILACGIPRAKPKRTEIRPSPYLSAAQFPLSPSHAAIMVYDSSPKPRQKSCQGCKSAKRRCDLASPACSRCVQRKINCIYHGQPPPASMNWASETPPPIDLLQDAWQPHATIPQCQAEYNIIGPQFPLDIFQDIKESHVNAQDKSARNSCLSQSHEEESSFNFELAVTRTRTRPPRPFSEVLASRLQFSIDAFKDAPRMMLLENQTPWCHSHLYKHNMPKSMQGKCHR